MKFFIPTFNLSRLSTELKLMLSYQNKLFIIVRGPTGSGKSTVAETMFGEFGNQIEMDQKKELHDFGDVSEYMKNSVGLIIMSNSEPELDMIKYASHGFHHNYLIFVIDLMVFIMEVNRPNIPSHQMLFELFSKQHTISSHLLISNQITDYQPLPCVAQQVLNYRLPLLCLRDLMDQPYKLEFREVNDFMNPSWDDEAYSSEIDREREESTGESEDIVEDEGASDNDIDEQGEDINDEDGETEYESGTAGSEEEEW